MPRNKMTTRERKKALLKQLEKCHGIVTTACAKVDCNTKTHYNYYNSDKKYAKEVDRILEDSKEFVESKLLDRINRGDTTAIIFYLKTKGKDLGYDEKRSFDIDGQIEIEIIEKKDKDK